MTAKKIIKLSIVIILLLSIFKTAVTVMAEDFDCAANKHNYAMTDNIPSANKEKDVCKIYREYTGSSLPDSVGNEEQNMFIYGVVTYKCRLCESEYTKTIYASEHQWSDWETLQEPTCTEAGIRKRTCNIGSSHVKTEPIPVAGHQYVETVVEPNCEEAGKKIYVCSTCGGSYTEEFAEAGEHHYIETITIEPSCGNDGIKTFTCDGCGDNYTQAIPQLLHIYGEWVIETPAKEGVEGSMYKKCVLCENRVWEILPPKPIFGVAEAVVTGVNLTAWVIFFFLLFGEFSLLMWELRKRKEILMLKRFDENGEDGYEYI